MSADMSPYNGSLVAFEGLSEDALDTQLRLLPTSSQILVLPSLQQYLQEEDSLLSAAAAAVTATSPRRTGPRGFSSSTSRTLLSATSSFDACQFVTKVHEAAAARRAVALEFLGETTSASGSSSSSRPPTSSSRRTARGKKIVFLNGGTAASRALCIEAIRQHDPAAGGDLERAALLFDQLTADGVAGMEQNYKNQKRRSAAATTIASVDVAPPPPPIRLSRQAARNSRREPQPQPQPPKFDDDEDALLDDSILVGSTAAANDPASQAMRAADALDRATEALQPTTHDLDLTIRPRPRSLSLPIHGELLDLLASGAGDVAPHRLSGQMSIDDHGSSIWVRPSVAAGAAGSEIYDYVPVSPSTQHLSPTSTIFPVSMRLDAIAAQQLPPVPPMSPRNYVSYTSATTGETMRTVVIGPAPRGRSSARRGRSSRDSSRRRARSLERQLSIGRTGSISGSSGLGMNFLLSSSREPSATRGPSARRRGSSVTSEHAPSNMLSDSSSSTGPQKRRQSTASTVPEVPLLPAADALEKLARKKAGARPPPQSKPQLRLKTSMAPTASLQSSSSLSSTTAMIKRPPAYVDRGTDASLDSGVEPFEPVLPLMEDLVIRFDDGRTNAVLDLAIQRCQDVGGARVIMGGTQSQQRQLQQQLDEQFDQKTMSSALPETPKSEHEQQPADELLPATTYTPVAPTAATSTFSGDDYDPFAPHEYNAGPKLPPATTPRAIRTNSEAAVPMPIKTPQPPTPAHTPPPPIPDAPRSAVRPAGTDDHCHHPRFHTILTSEHRTVAALQNALRAVLGAYFPPEDNNKNGKRARSSSTSGAALAALLQLPGMDDGSLWAPLFGNSELGMEAEVSSSSNSSRLDMVLAVGAQRGVPPELTARIVALLDSLGAKPTGAARSGRLDIRYLVANAVQALAAQQVRSRAPRSSFADGDLLAAAAAAADGTHALATLVLAQLDLYLRTYSAVRFVVLDYPLELLVVVLALQRLVGRDVVQVASVVQAAETPSSRPAFQVTNANARRESSSSTLASPPSLVLDPERPPVSKANFLLTSAVSAADVASFVSLIWKRLVAGSPGAAAYYGPQNPATVAAQTQTQAQTAAGPAPVQTQEVVMTSSHTRKPTLMTSPTLPGVGGYSGANANANASASSSSPRAKKTERRTTPTSVPEHITTTPTKSIRAPPSPVPSVKSIKSVKSAKSMKSQATASSQADSWRTMNGNAAKSPGLASNYTTASSNTPGTVLTPAPALPLSGGRLVAKTIQVGGPQARRPREQVPVMSSGRPATASVVTTTTNGNSRDWDADIDAFDDEDYGFVDEDDDYDDDFDEDPDMRRLMPLFMRDRAALLAAKEASGARGVVGSRASSGTLRPRGIPAGRSKANRLTGSMDAPTQVSAPVPISKDLGYGDSQRNSAATAPPLRSRTVHDLRDYHQQLAGSGSASALALRSRVSVNSMRSASGSSGGTSGNNDGKKALKWLGLA